MARYVIIVRLDTSTLTQFRFNWEVRELLGEATQSPLERSGRVLASGLAADATTARHDAEVVAEQLALENVYIYNTTTQEPTPLPSP